MGHTPAPGPIFVVGPSRSGTALVRSIVNLHPDVHLASETHYFDDLRRKIADPEHLTDGDRDLCVDYFGALTHRPYGHSGVADLGWLDDATFRERAAERGGTADAHLQAFCEMSAGREGAAVWGEKTPRHVFRIDDILESFPNARVIAMVRDPRAVVASYKRWRNQGGLPGEDDVDHESKLADEEERARRSYHPLLLAMLWRGQAKAALAGRQRHGTDRVWVQRYEDLVGSPESSVEALVAWLGLEFSPAMLDVPMLNSSFSKYRTGQGISTEALARWIEVLDDPEVAIVQRACASPMTAFDYEPRSLQGTVGGEARLVAEFPGAALRAARANSERSGGLPTYVARRLRAMVGG